MEQDAWLPVLKGEDDSETGRKDGGQKDGENCWANIGPRRYVTEYPAWGLNESKDGWRVDFFYVVFEAEGEGSTKDGRLELVSHSGKGLRLDKGGDIYGHPWYRIKLVPKSEAMTFVLRDDKRVQCLDLDQQFMSG